jgi:hypothetical protein
LIKRNFADLIAPAVPKSEKPDQKAETVAEMEDGKGKRQEGQIIGSSRDIQYDMTSVHQFKHARIYV